MKTQINYTDENLIKAISMSISLKDTLKNMKLPITRGYYNSIKEKIDVLGIDTSHFLGGKNYKSRSVKNNLNELLVENSLTPRNNLKKKLLYFGLLTNICSECGQGSIWNNKPLVMVLDHINGINNDNRIENLRMLCSNCNSQQPTFAGRNVKNRVIKFCNKCQDKLSCRNISGLCAKCMSEKKKILREKFIKIEKSKKEKQTGRSKIKKFCHCGEEIHYRSKTCQKCFHNKERKIKERPSKENLLIDIKHLSLLQIGNKYGVSDNTIRKWLKQYQLPYFKKDIKSMSKEDTRVGSHNCLENSSAS